MISKEELLEAVSYDPVTGEFTWIRPDKKHNFLQGLRAGSDEGRYRRIQVRGCRLLEHQAAYLAMAGTIPLEIDHINHDGKDNRWANLREVCHSFNLITRQQFARNSSGYVGVSWHKRKNKWRASLNYAGSRYWLGCFKTKEEASQAYQAKLKEVTKDSLKTVSAMRETLLGQIAELERRKLEPDK